MATIAEKWVTRLDENSSQHTQDMATDEMDIIDKAKGYIIGHPNATAEEVIRLYGYEAWENATWELAMDGR
jgi:hypothetical protein